MELRKSVWLVALGAALLIVWISPTESPTNNLEVQSQPAAKRGSSQGTDVSSTRGARDRDVAIVALDRDAIEVSNIDPFRVASVVPPSVQIPASTPKTAPVVLPPAAPIFPYRYLGRMIGVDGIMSTYLAKGDQLIPVRENDVLDTNYRIDFLNKMQVGVTYIPLGEQIILPAQSGLN